jgi:hypothetical protein
VAAGLKPTEDCPSRPFEFCGGWFRPFGCVRPAGAEARQPTADTPEPTRMRPQLRPRDVVSQPKVLIGPEQQPAQIRWACRPVSYAPRAGPEGTGRGYRHRACDQGRVAIGCRRRARTRRGHECAIRHGVDQAPRRVADTPSSGQPVYPWSIAWRDEQLAEPVAEFVRTAHKLAREKRWTSVDGGLAPIWLPPDDPAISALLPARSP